MSDTPVLTAALAYAERGWRVFPCHTVRAGGCTCGVAGCDSQGKHPLTVHGVKDATSDKTAILQWWQRWPDANVGIAAGPDSGLVLDVDPGKGGDESLRDLEREHGELPSTPTSHTGGGGLHLIFAYPDLAEGEIAKNKADIAPGLDIRAEGGYIIAAPSLHISGRRYEWDVEDGPDAPLADLPDWLRAMVVSHVDTAAPAEPIGAKILAGTRSQTLTSLAGTMQRRGFSEEAIAAALLVENRLKCVPRLSDVAVRKIAYSVSHLYPPSAPAVVPIKPPRPVPEELRHAF